MEHDKNKSIIRFMFVLICKQTMLQKKKFAKIQWKSYLLCFLTNSFIIGTTIELVAPYFFFSSLNKQIPDIIQPIAGSVDLERYR